MLIIIYVLYYYFPTYIIQQIHAEVPPCLYVTIPTTGSAHNVTIYKTTSPVSYDVQFSPQDRASLF